jgi:subtilisin family serine protease
MAVVGQKAKTRSLTLVSSQEIGAGVLKGLEKADGVVFERLGVVVINEVAAEKVRRLLTLRDSPFVSAEPERYLYKQARSLKNNAAATWGIQAINVRNSRYTGKDVKMAVLDTGFDFTHPDFAGRVIHRKSFVGRQAKDREGHGTFCVGIAGGGRKGKAGPRYGVASGARLFVGKILDDAGEGSDATALAGIEWALDKGCQVISMSFGAAVTAGEGYSEIFEDVARTAMANNCLLIAATGNESDREEGIVGLINHPANCPSVLAVAALTEALQVANYSCAGMKKLSGKSAGGRGASGGLGEVNIAAPGDNIMSACMGGGHDEESGTSMATPFVAGVVALLWEQFPKAGAGEIWKKLIKGVEPIGQPKVDVGAGLVFVR